jgi:membrane fusion protein, adhesin transport system
MEVKIISLTALSLFAAGFWAYNAPIDKVVHAQGVYVGTKTNIQAPVDGIIISEVAEGEKVKQGQVLAVFDQKRVTAIANESGERIGSLQASKIRLMALINNTEPNFQGVSEERKRTEYSLYLQQLKTLKEKVSGIERHKKYSQEEVEGAEKLYAKGLMTKPEYLKYKKEENEINLQKTDEENKFFQDLKNELNKVNEQLSVERQTYASRADLNTKSYVYAPTAGTIKNIKFNKGSVLRMGEEIMQLTPEATGFEFRIKPADVGFVTTGQDVNIKIDAFDYSIYGSLKGKIIYISPDTIDENLKQNEAPYYRIKVETGDYKYKVLPGMTATADIIIGKNTIWNYLTKPLTKTLDNSFKEK